MLIAEETLICQLIGKSMSPIHLLFPHFPSLLIVLAIWSLKPFAHLTECHRINLSARVALLEYFQGGGSFWQNVWPLITLR
jgi:hypothetical protein